MTVQCTCLTDCAVQMAHHDIVRHVATYIRALDSSDDVETVAQALFRYVEL